MTSPLRTEFVSKLPRPRLRRWASKLFIEVRKSQISKFLGSFRYRNYANFIGMPAPQIANPQIFTINPQIANPQIYKVSVLHKKLEHYMLFMVGEKNMYLRTCGSPQIIKKIGPANRNSAKCHICGSSANSRRLEEGGGGVSTL
jgi:hypothetical protein